MLVEQYPLQNVPVTLPASVTWACVAAKPFVAERKKLGYPIFDEATRAKLKAEEEE